VEPLEVQGENQRRTEDEKLLGGVAVDTLRFFLLNAVLRVAAVFRVAAIFRVDAVFRVDSTACAVLYGCEAAVGF
jgi:hypothetical protein